MSINWKFDEHWYEHWCTLIHDNIYSLQFSCSEKYETEGVQCPLLHRSGKNARSGKGILQRCCVRTAFFRGLQKLFWHLSFFDSQTLVLTKGILQSHSNHWFYLGNSRTSTGFDVYLRNSDFFLYKNLWRFPLYTSSWTCYFFPASFFRRSWIFLTKS